MKAIRQYEFGKADVLKLEEMPIPAIKQNEVLIRGAYTSVNYADIKSRIGSKTKGKVIHSAAGGVGSMLTQLAKLCGVRKIIATVGDIQKADYVTRLGADIVCHYDRFVDTVLEETEGKGATVIFDSVAGDITQRSLACLANYGTLVQFGNSSGQAGQISTTDVHSSCRNIKGFSLGTTRKEDPERLAPAAEKVFDYLLAGNIRIPIAGIFDLKDVQQAHHLMESRTHQGKILLKL